MNIAKALLDIEAVVLSPKKPFTWASGIKSPIYCDNRLTLSYPLVRNRIIDEFVKIIEFNFPTVEMIMGTATAGIPHAALIADRLGLPMGFVRSKSKGHGRENQIEGHYNKNDKVIVIEDLISTGTSSLNAAWALQKAGLDVLGVVAIFSYELRESTLAFANARIPLKTITNYSELMEFALSDAYITEEEFSMLEQWKENPHDKSWIK